MSAITDSPRVGLTGGAAESNTVLLQKVALTVCVISAIAFVIFCPGAVGAALSIPSFLPSAVPFVFAGLAGVSGVLALGLKVKDYMESREHAKKVTQSQTDEVLVPQASATSTTQDPILSFLLTGKMQGQPQYDLELKLKEIADPTLQEKAVTDLEGGSNFGHTFIQTYFPKAEPSKMQSTTPYMTPARLQFVRAQSAADLQLMRGHVLQAFQIMVRFYGFTYDPQSRSVSPGTDPFSLGRLQANWAIDGDDHNRPRMARIMNSLNRFGFRQEAENFYKVVSVHAQNISERTRREWASAKTIPTWDVFQQFVE